MCMGVPSQLLRSSAGAGFLERGLFTVERVVDEVFQVGPVIDLFLGAEFAGPVDLGDGKCHLLHRESLLCEPERCSAARCSVAHRFNQASLDGPAICVPPIGFLGFVREFRRMQVFYRHPLVLRYSNRAIRGASQAVTGRVLLPLIVKMTTITLSSAVCPTTIQRSSPSTC